MTNAFVEPLVWLLIAGLWWMFYGPIRKYQCDRARYRLFVIRDELFDIAARGSDIKFDDRAYGIARTTLNGMLRNVEDFSVGRLMFLIWRASRDDHWKAMRDQYSREFESAAGELSPEGRRSIHRAMGDANHVMVAYMLRRSLMLLALGAIGKLLRPIGVWIARIRQSKQIEVAINYDSNVAGHGEIAHGAAA